MSTKPSPSDVAEVHRLGPEGARDGAPPHLLLEVPHGATRGADFAAVRRRLAGAFADDLLDYFFVNTDAGAPELAAAIARHVRADRPDARVELIRCLVPRTFVDCNRVIDAATVPSSSTAGDVTPGIASYVKEPGDVAYLFACYEAYRTLTTAAYERCIDAGGLAWMVHSYAPRTVELDVDERIVERLHEAYRPERITRFRLRPEVDLISRDPEGVTLADEGLVAAVSEALGRAGYDHAQCATYELHPLTQGHRFASRWPGRTLCLEARRDLLAGAFVPFCEQVNDPVATDRLAGVLAEALGPRLPSFP